MAMPSLVVVVPTYNEEIALPALLASVRSQADATIRVVIADGGSTDATKAAARSFGAQVVETGRKGRGCQIAAAVNGLQEEIVLILHADTIVPQNAIQRILDWMAEHPSCPGGCLGHRFDSPRIIYRFVECWDSLRARWGTSYGDQAQFFRRELIEGVGGFPNQPIMEDWELSRQLSTLGRPVYLNFCVQVSSRRVEHLGWIRTGLMNFFLRLEYRLRGRAGCWDLYERYYQLPTAKQSRLSGGSTD